MSHAKETFRLPRGLRVAFAMLFILPPLSAATMQLWLVLHERQLGAEHLLDRLDIVPLVASTCFGVGMFLGLMRFSTVAVDDDGVTYNRIWRFPWDDVVGARGRSVFGLRYIHVRRRSGAPVWLPLYYVGQRPLRDALLRHAPDGNPIGRCLAPDAG